MIDFGKKTYANILAEQLAKVPDTLDKREGSIIQTALGPESWYLEGVYLDLEKVQENVYADTASGIYLDRITGQAELHRKAATPAIKKGVFNVQVPFGSRFSALTGSGYLGYKVLEPLDMEENSYTYKMQCETAGEIGNSYVGRIVAVDYVTGLKSAQITTLLESGREEETDEALRERFLIKARRPSTSGNRYDYYNWAMECAGVGAAKVFPLASGPGTVKVVIADADRQAAPASLVGDVSDHIEELRPVGATVTVVSAKELKINVSANVRLKNGINLGQAQEEYTRVVAEYLKDNAFDTSYISIARMGSLLLDIPGIEDLGNLLLNGLAKNVVLSDEEIAVTGTVVLEVM